MPRHPTTSDSGGEGAIRHSIWHLSGARAAAIFGARTFPIVLAFTTRLPYKFCAVAHVCAGAREVLT